MKLTRAIAVGLVSLFLAMPIRAGGRNSPQLSDSVDLPAAFDFDFSLASKMRSQIGAVRDLSADDSAIQAGQTVFESLTKSQMVSSLRLPYRWTFSLVRSADLNAVSLPDGEVAAYQGLAKLIGTDRGLWAAVLSHEIAHVERRHAVRKALYRLYLQRQIEYYRMRQRYGDKSAGWTVLALQVSGTIAEKKLSRDLEHDADSQGMLLMARAGYHPDYVFAMHHLMRLASGEQSKFGAFFSDHPRWETRDQRGERAYMDALAEYNRLWPDPTSSPGGQAPTVAFLGKPKTSESEQRSSGDIVLPVSCRNARSPITLIVRLTDKEGRSLATLDGAETQRRMMCLDRDDAVPTTIHIPSTIAGHERMVKAYIDFVESDGFVLERSREINVHLPKVPKAETRVMAKVDVEPSLVENVVVGQELPPVSPAVKTPAPAPTVAAASSQPVAPDHPAVIQPTSLAPILAQQVSVGAIRGLEITVETDANGGARIVKESPGRVAEWIGLRLGYIITGLNGRPIGTAGDLAAAMTNRELGSPIKVRYMFRSQLGEFQKETLLVLPNESR
jgi:Zn-dependent protease with chaperone function